jgi:membrane-associated protein
VDVLLTLDTWVLALTGSPWVFVALYAFCVIDGFFPPIPSETAVIGLAVLAMATGDPNLWLVLLVATLGAFTGDQVAYSIGRRIPVRRFRLLRGPRSQRAVDVAERALAERGASYIIAARYIPVGRVAVNMTAGTVGYSRRRFSGLAAIAAASWSMYSVLLGMSAGLWLKEHPYLAVVVGVALGLFLGVVIDAVLRRLLGGRRGRRPAIDGAVTVAVVPGPGAPLPAPQPGAPHPQVDTPSPAGG